MEILSERYELTAEFYFALLSLAVALMLLGVAIEQRKFGFRYSITYGCFSLMSLIIALSLLSKPVFVHIVIADVDDFNTIDDCGFVLQDRINYNGRFEIRRMVGMRENLPEGIHDLEGGERNGMCRKK